MNDYFQENKRSLTLLTGLLIILAIVLFFILIRPLTAELSSKEKEIKSVEDEIELFTKQLENMNEAVQEKGIEQVILENKIPAERNLDEYILSLQRLEVMTNSKIDKITFMYDSNLDEMEDDDEEIEEQAEEQTDALDENEEFDDIEVTEKITMDPVILTEKPDNLHVMTVRVEGASPDFDELINLLKVIENEDRISIVSNLKFNKPTEYDYFVSENEKIALSFEAELSTFYYEE